MTSAPVFERRPPSGIRSVDIDQPWTWLAAGWRDLWRVPQISLAYGAAVTLASYLLTALLLYFDALPVVLPLAAGFMLVGPMLAVGLYEASRRLEAGEPVPPVAVAFVATRSPAQLAFLGVILTVLLLAWWRIAMLLFALFFGLSGFPPIDVWLEQLLLTPSGLVFLVVGTAIGAGLAFVAFAISVVSVPMLLARDTDAVTAVIMSLQAVRHNLPAMVLWAWLVALLTTVGIATAFLGLIVLFPLVGHATWHAYRAIVADTAQV